MNIYSDSTEYVPYTYLIGWSKLDRWYYGAQTGVARTANPKNLWTVYYTSSVYVKKFRQLHGEPDVIQIRKTFKDKESCLYWEYQVLKRLKAVKSPRWLNKGVSGKTFYCVRYGSDNPSNRPEVRQKIREALKGRQFTDEHRNKISLARLGCNKGKTYEEIYGETKASELKAIRSAAQKGKPKSKKVKTIMRDRTTKWWRIYPPCGESIIVHGLVSYCRDNNLDVSSLHNTAYRPYNNDGKLRFHKGYRAEAIASSTDVSNIASHQSEAKADNKTKLYEITWPCGRTEIIRGLGEFARSQGWPEGALYDVKDKMCLDGRNRKYRGVIVKTIT
jgi:hypothetical protein